ncbi:MAG: hypothetical protein Q9190_001233 [Brigantiaea leucoxantha]
MDDISINNSCLDYRSNWGSRSSRPISSSDLSKQAEAIFQSVEPGSDIGDENEAFLSDSARQSSGLGEAVFDLPSRQSSPRTSHHSDEGISQLSLGSQDPPSPLEQRPSSPFTPLKMHSPFRNPSSVRAMQMDTTPPPFLPSSFSKNHNNVATSSRNGTPHSVTSRHSAMRSPSKRSPTKKVKKEYPLVLLHVTLLPIPALYSQEVMQSVLPDYVLENWKILRAKAADTVLERGILIPHPKEDYDLLEERLLESLDLKTPRILKCGHFHLDPVEEAEILGSETDEFDDDYDDKDVCEDCGRRIRNGHYGSGSGNRRWDIKLFAANGLMRAGAWSAAWREMERVDVEILPWMDEEMKRELELRSMDEHRQAEILQLEAIQETRKNKETSDARMREIYGDDLSQALNGSVEDGTTTSSPLYGIQDHRVPLGELLRNYLIHAVQDRRNLAILLLSTIILVMSLQLKSQPPIPSISTQAAHSTSTLATEEPAHSVVFTQDHQDIPTPSSSPLTTPFASLDGSVAASGNEISDNMLLYDDARVSSQPSYQSTVGVRGSNED